MQATSGSVQQIFNANKQFIVPLYQRMYSWGHEQCEKLWDDIVDLEKSHKKGHFIGSIVSIVEKISISGTPKFLVIDGQQRLTTLTILLIALRDFLNSENINNSITDNFLKNRTQNDDELYKLVLTYNDRDVLIKLIEKTAVDDIKNSRILDTYKFFLTKISSKILTQQEIEDAIIKLQIVDISLEPQSDDPQSIFESLNSTGMALSQSDLIRNFILMGLASNEQNELYRNLWLPTEKLFDYEKQSYLMDGFFRDYLTMKNSRIPKIENVYAEFKQFYTKISLSHKELCEDIYNFAKCYTNIVFSRSTDEELNSIFTDIHLLKMEVAYPFLMLVYNDYINNVIERGEFIDILKLTESYVLRRAICEIPTNSLNKTFAVMKNKVVPGDYLNSIKAHFISLDSYKAFPKDEEFIKFFSEKNIYQIRIRNYILSKLERFDNKEKLDLDSFTIEHVMPENENLRYGWKEALGENWQEIHSQYLHTIGNLTLTAYNSEMSDRSFSEKLTMKGGFRESGLRLNSYIREQNEWNKDKIIERAKILSERARQIWSYPKISGDILQKFQQTPGDVIEYTFENYKDSFSENTLSLYEILDKKIMNLDASVRREYKKLYIAYKFDTNFVDIIPQKGSLCLSINLDFKKVYDPEELCENTEEKGRWGNGEVCIRFQDISKIDYVMSIISQALNAQLDE